jgi:hypothetical protein
MTLMAIHIMFPIWEQALRRAAALVVTGPIIVEWRPVFSPGLSSCSDAGFRSRMPGATAVLADDG